MRYDRNLTDGEQLPKLCGAIQLHVGFIGEHGLHQRHQGLDLHTLTKENVYENS